MTTGTSFVEGSDSGTMNMMAKHAGKVLVFVKILPDLDRIIFSKSRLSVYSVAMQRIKPVD